MIGELPTTLEVNGRELQILSTDYRNSLLIFQAFNDPDLTDNEKQYIMIDALLGVNNLGESEMKEASEKCSWYLDGGKNYDSKRPEPKTMDWNQDEQLIFSAVNHVAGKELRTEKYIHWWTFLGYFNEIQDGLFSYVLSIRQKRAKHKKLEKYEQEYYNAHKDLIDIEVPESDADKAYKEELNQRFK
jgi:hypothetical protein